MHVDLFQTDLLVDILCLEVTQRKPGRAVLRMLQLEVPDDQSVFHHQAAAVQNLPGFLHLILPEDIPGVLNDDLLPQDVAD